MYWIWKNLGTCSITESFTPEGTIIIDVRDLNDSGENSVEAIKIKIATIINLMTSGEKIVVRCLAGMSRSNTIACASMMCFDRTHMWEHYWHIIEKACPRARQNLEFVDVVKKALLELGIDRKRLYYD